MVSLPQPRGETSERVLDALARNPGSVAQRRSQSGGSAGRRRPPAGALLLLRAALRRPARGGRALGVGSRGCSDNAPGSSASSRRTLSRRRGRAAGSGARREMDLALRAIADADDGPSLSSYIERQASLAQLEEFVVHRSAYQLKEADPHSWALPRLSGPPKAALVEIQADEYGGGRPERIHAFSVRAGDGGARSRPGAGRLPRRHPRAPRSPR